MNKRNNGCKIKECNLRHKALGFCNRHYRRYRAHGDPEKLIIDQRMKWGESSLNALFYIYKKNAEKRNIKFLLNKDYFRFLTKQRCFYCNKAPSSRLKYANLKGFYLYNGIDRLDSNKNYTLENCVTSCSKCNFMKRDLSFSEFLYKIKAILRNLQEKNRT